MAKKKSAHRLTAWDMHQIAKNSAEKGGDKFLLEALEICKKRGGIRILLCRI